MIGLHDEVQFLGGTTDVLSMSIILIHIVSYVLSMISFWIVIKYNLAKVDPSELFVVGQLTAAMGGLPVLLLFWFYIWFVGKDYRKSNKN